MNWYTPCRYQPDCVVANGAVRPPASASWPSRVLRRYSPCSLKLVRVALPLGAHFHTPSAIHTRLLPVKNGLVTTPCASVASSDWSTALAPSMERPARQRLSSPTSPPACAYSAVAPAPFCAVLLPG